MVPATRAEEVSVPGERACVTCRVDVVSVPDTNQPQRGSLPVSHVGILEVIRAGVGLGPRLGWMWMRTFQTVHATS